MSEDNLNLKQRLPNQVDPNAFAEAVELEKSTKAAVTSGALGVIATGIATGASAIMISFIGFSETLAFLPMININYPVKLVYFFRGISGMNFQFFDIAEHLGFIDLPTTAPPREDRFENAGFESQALILSTADIILLALITFASFLI